MDPAKLIEKRKCLACGNEERLHDHHIIPQFMNAENQKTVVLCSVHHNIIHNFLNKVIWSNKNLSQEELEKKIDSFTHWFCKMEWAKWNPINKRSFLSNHCIVCREPSRFYWWDYETSMGLFGLCKKCATIEEYNYKVVKNASNP